MKLFGYLSPALKLAAIAIAGVAITGCGATRAAYKAADNAEDRAFVAAEHYQALQHEAAALVEQPGTPAEVRAAIKAIDAKATPLILGDSATGRASLRDLAQILDAAQDALATARNAETEAAAAAARAQFEAAMTEAITEIANLIRVLRKNGVAAMRLYPPLPYTDQDAAGIRPAFAA